MFPKRGRDFPADARRSSREFDYAALIASALRQELGGTHQATKTIMRWTGANERTVKNWLAGTSGPSGEHLIGLITHSDEVLDVLLRSANRMHSLAAQKLFKARNTLATALGQFDRLMIEKRQLR